MATIDPLSLAQTTVNPTSIAEALAEIVSVNGSFLDTYVQAAEAAALAAQTAATSAQAAAAGAETTARANEILRRGDFFQRIYLQAADRVAGDSFGRSCALSADGSVLAVGAYLQDDPTDSGGVYVYDLAGSSATQRLYLQSADRATSDYFGVSCALSADGSVLAVGASAQDDPTDSGGVYVYDLAGSSATQRLYFQSADRAVSDQFGISCALSADGSVLAVGAYAQDDPTDSGGVYVYQTIDGLIRNL